MIKRKKIGVWLAEEVLKIIKKNMITDRRSIREEINRISKEQNKNVGRDIERRIYDIVNVLEALKFIKK